MSSSKAANVGAAIPQPQDFIEANSDSGTDQYSGDGGDSDYETGSGESATTSIVSAIYDYVYENGRRYHAFREGKYALPNDETEQERLDIIHHVLLLVLDGFITAAPIGNNPQNILDIGTGTGIWAIDAADTYPSAEVIGTDLSAIQPVWVPPNCKFEVDDAEHDWTYKENYFDLIHSRHLAQSIKDWPAYINRIYKHTKPGGFIELWEAELSTLNSDDNTYHEGSPLHTWMQHFQDATEQMGIPDPTGSLERWVKEAGFVDVTVKKYKTPWGPWPKDKKLREIGKFMMLNCESAFEAYGLALLTRHAGMTPEDAKKLCQGARADVFNRHIHVYNYQWCVVGRKPQ